MKDKELQEFLAKGHILVRAIFEMIGSPKEHVESTLKQYIEAVKEDPDYIFMKEYYAPTEEHDGLWSTFFESEVLVTTFDKLNVLCFNLAPASIEIIKPDEFHLTQKHLGLWYNDLLSKIHETSASMKSLNSENDLLKLNLNRSIRNCVILALSEPKNVDELTSKVGIDKEHLQPFLDAMIRENAVIEDEDHKYNIKK